jgi:hypothetical protein
VRPVPPEIPPEQVEGVIRVDEPFGFGVFIDSNGDGSCEIQVFTPFSIDLREIQLQLNQQIRVTGFSGEFNQIPPPISPHEVNPRFQTDIK